MSASSEPSPRQGTPGSLRSSGRRLLKGALTFTVALACVHAAPAGAARSARAVSLSVPRIDARGDLVLSGSTRSRRGDVAVFYLASRCVRTLRSARRGRYVIAYGPLHHPAGGHFRATLDPRVVRPRRGRACYLLADSKRRTRVRASRGYRMP